MHCCVTQLRALRLPVVALPALTSFLSAAAYQLESMPLSRISTPVPSTSRGYGHLPSGRATAVFATGWISFANPARRETYRTNDSHFLHILTYGDMNSTAITLTETALLSQLPHSSRIVSPTQRVFIKHPDGIWRNWANGVCTNRRLQPAHDIPAGSWACLPNEPTRPHCVKHANGSWLAANPSSAAFAANNPVPALQILPQTTFRRGPAPVDQCVVPFNVSMPAAEQGRVPDATSHAFVGELAAQEKATIRFGLQHLESSGYQHRQHNLQRYGAPVVRGQLAISIAEEVRRVMDALEEIGKPLSLPSGRRVAFEDLVLVDIKRVSRGSLQPTLAVRSA